MPILSDKKKLRAANQQAHEIHLEQIEEVGNASREVINSSKNLVAELQAEFAAKEEEILADYTEGLNALEEHIREQAASLEVELAALQEELDVKKLNDTKERLNLYAACKENLESSKAMDMKRLSALATTGIDVLVMEKLWQKLEQYYAEKQQLIEDMNRRLDNEIHIHHSHSSTELVTHRYRFDMLRDDLKSDLRRAYDKQMGELYVNAKEIFGKIDTETRATLDEIRSQYEANLAEIRKNLNELLKQSRRQANIRRLNVAIGVGSVACLAATGGLSSLITFKVMPLLGSTSLACTVNGALLANGIYSITNLVEKRDIASLYFRGNVTWNASSGSLTSSLDNQELATSSHASLSFTSIEQLRQSVLNSFNILSTEQYSGLEFGLLAPRLDILRQPTLLPLGLDYGVAFERDWGLNITPTFAVTHQSLHQSTSVLLRRGTAVQAQRNWGLTVNMRLNLEANSPRFQIMFAPTPTCMQFNFANQILSSSSNHDFATRVQPTRTSLGERILNWFIPAANASEIPLESFRTEAQSQSPTSMLQRDSEQSELRYQAGFDREYMIAITQNIKVGLHAKATVNHVTEYAKGEDGKVILKSESDVKGGVNIAEGSWEGKTWRASGEISLLSSKANGKVHFDDEQPNYVSGDFSYRVCIIEGSYSANINRICIRGICLDPELRINPCFKMASFGDNSKWLMISPNISRDPDNTLDIKGLLIEEIPCMIFLGAHKLASYVTNKEDTDVQQLPSICRKSHVLRG